MPNASKVRINGMVFESVDDESLIQDIKTLKDELVLELIPSVLASFVSARTGTSGRFAVKSEDNRYAVLDEDTSARLMYIIKTHNRVSKIHEHASLNKYAVSLTKDCIAAVCGFATSSSLSSDDDGVYVMADAIVDPDGNVIDEYEDPKSVKIAKKPEEDLVDSVICATRLSDALNAAFPAEKEPPGYSRAPAAVQFSIA